MPSKSLRHSIDTKRALALSTLAFALPVLFSLILDACVLPSQVRLEDVHSVFQGPPPVPVPAVYEQVPTKATVHAQPTVMAAAGSLAKRQNKEDEESSKSRSSKSRESSKSSSEGSTDNKDRSGGATALEDNSPAKATTITKDGKTTTIISKCAWSREIQGTSTTPLWLTLGLSAGDIAGILLGAFTAYQYGKAKHVGGGAGGAPPGGAPPPMY